MSPEVMTSASAASSSSPDASKILSKVNEVRHSAKLEQALTFTINKSTANYVIGSLQSENENVKVSFDASLNQLRILVMPSRMHECVAGWLSREFFHWHAEGTFPMHYTKLFRQLPCPEIKSFIGAHANTRKTPDFTFWPKNAPWPSVVLEAGYSESWPNLQADKHLWSVGSGYQVNVIILVKLYSADMAGRVEAKIEVSVFSGQGLETVYSERLLPLPAAPLASISIAHNKLFGATLPANATVSLSLDRLRNDLTEEIIESGFKV